VLFLDELPEFARNTLESLRQPLESGEAVIARANQHMRYPAEFQLIAAMNPCRCGHLGTVEMECTKAPRCGAEYQGKISGPMLDRFDVVIDVPAVDVRDLSAEGGECSQSVAERVLNARKRQIERSKILSADQSVFINARADGAFLEGIAVLSTDAKMLLDQAMDRARFSARGYFRLLRVARTIADLESDVLEISRVHMAEALSYRRVSL
jgi:magnesium chelatase family protein